MKQFNSVSVFSFSSASGIPEIADLKRQLELEGDGPLLSGGFESVQRFFIEWQSGINQQLDDAVAEFFDVSAGGDASKVENAVTYVRASENDLHRIRKVRELIEISLSDLRRYDFGDPHSRIAHTELVGGVTHVILGLSPEEGRIVGIRMGGYYS